MKRRRHTPEQIVRKLREADRMLADGAEAPEVPRRSRSPTPPTPLACAVLGQEIDLAQGGVDRVALVGGQRLRVEPLAAGDAEWVGHRRALLEVAMEHGEESRSSSATGA